MRSVDQALRLVAVGGGHNRGRLRPLQSGRTLAGLEAIARRGADRGGRVGVGEPHALLGQPFQVGRSTEEESIDSEMVSRRIKQAQQKISRKMRHQADAESAAQWFERNCPDMARK